MNKDNPNYYASYAMLSGDDFNIINNKSQVNTEMLDAFIDAVRLYSVQGHDSTISFNLLDQSKKYYAPATTVGINVKTKNATLANKFATYLFSENSQKLDYSESSTWFPVNKKAFADGQAIPSQKTMDELNLGTTASDRVTWPSRSQWTSFTSMVES